MTPRFLPAALLTALLLTAGCDLTGSDDDITGFWEGTVSFEVDTVLTEQNLRIVGDYEATFSFDLEYGNNLVEGVVFDDFRGELVVEEAGGIRQTITLDGPLFGAFDAFGTYVDPELEVDVPDGPYQDNLWTFEVSGRRAESESFIVQQWPILLRDGSEFTFSITSDEPFDMRREDRPDDLDLTAADVAAPSASRLFPAHADRFEVRRQRSEQ